MKLNLGIFLLIFIATLAFWHKALYNFFTQDDFILIWHFSQNSLIDDLKNVFGVPAINHWRPVHNLYYFVAGNIFGKNYLGYHLLTIFIHALAAFSIFKIGQILVKNNVAALTASLFYSVHPAHFVSMFWISGSVPIVGFLFLNLSFWAFLKKKKVVAFILFILAIFASEAMISGIAVFAAFAIFKRFRDLKFLSMIAVLGIIFLLVKLSLTSSEAFEIYNPEISIANLEATRYYALRSLGFAEISGDQLASAGILIFWAIAILLSFKLLKLNLKPFSLPAVSVVAGLFPFVLIPSHLSPHYMSISIWGLSMFLCLFLKKSQTVWFIVLMFIFTAVSTANVMATASNNWVTKRSIIAKTYLQNIEKSHFPVGSTLIFRDSQISTSKEAYIALGTGEALNFWFAGKNYKYCFTFFEECKSDEEA